MHYRFPEGFDDETLFSVISRHHILSGYGNAQSTLSNLFGINGYIPSSLLPSNIRELSDKTGLETDKLISDHTLWYLYAPFFSEKRQKRIQNQMLENGGTQIKATAGLLASSFGAHENLKYCKKCTKDDIKNHGVAFWHLSHQIPSSIYCTKHENPLIEVIQAGKKIKRHELFLPSQSQFYKSKRARNGIRSVNWSAFCNEFFRKQFIEINPDILKKAYKNSLMEQNLVHASGSIKLDEFAFTFKDFYKLSLGVDGISIFDSHKNTKLYIQRILREDRCYHAIQNLLMIYYLFESIDVFIDSYNHSSLLKVKIKTDSKKRNSNPKSFNYLKKYISQDLVKDLEEGISLKDINAKHKITCITLRRILNYLVETKKKRKVNIFIGNRDIRRKRIHENINNNPNVSRSKIRELNPADYIWLYNNDRTWFDTHMPEKTKPQQTQDRLDWADRDKKTSKIILLIQQEILNKKSKPIRVTKAEIMRRMEKSSFLQKYLHKLPECKKILDRAVESTEEFQIRRVIWAKEKLTKEKSLVYPSDISRMAGISTKHSNKVSKLIYST